MKRIFILILSLFIYFDLIAFDFSQVSPTGQVLYYNINDNKFTVSVTAPTNNTIGISYIGYEKPSGELIIPDVVTHNGINYTVTAVDKNAFSNCIDLKSVIISESIIDIGDESFKGCSNLRTVKINSNLKRIGGSAFLSCRKLQNINLPNSIEAISKHAFSNCVSLEQILLPENISIIEPYTFYSCEKLREIKIPNKVKYIGESAFAFCRNLEKIIMPTDLKVIDVKAFFSCAKLEKISLPTSLELLETLSFASCIALKTIEIPNSIEEIKNSVFKYCYNLETVILPNTIKLIDNNAFEYCKKLKNINIPNSVTSIGNASFSNCISLEHIDISSFVNEIGSYTFQNCTNLKSINIPSVKKIGKYAFERCRNLEEINLSEVKEIGEFAFTECSNLKKVELTQLDTIRNYVFYTCPKLEKVIFGDNIKTIGNYAFYRCYNLSSIQLPEFLYTIGLGAFEQCSNLRSVSFNRNIEIIYDYAFNNCKKLKNLTFKSVKPLKIYANTWKNLPKDVNITMPIVQDSFLLALNLEKKIGKVIIDAELVDTTKINQPTPIPLIAENIPIPEEIIIPVYQLEKPKEIEIPQKIDNDTSQKTNYLANNVEKEVPITVKNISLKVLVKNNNMGVAEGTGIYKESSDVKIFAKANKGYKFVSWSDGKKENPRFVKIKEDAVYYAIFEAEKYDVVVEADDKTMGNTYGSGNYELNSEQTITAEPFNGYQFVEWNDGENENPRKVVVTEKEQKYVAKFSPIKNTETKEKLSCYPNPTRGLVYLNKKAKQVDVLNTSGQLILSFKDQSVIDISDIPSGTYSLRVTINEEVQTLKVVLKK
ncbi:MAG: leucine-rich repeat domain-containing protein [Bacteroidales bacterium]|nr:leucine-rich repeat domain-containing protein [Bacteroidales bacterium]